MLWPEHVDSTLGQPMNDQSRPQADWQTDPSFDEPSKENLSKFETVNDKIADQSDLVFHSLGFSKKLLTSLFGVPRQHTYSWLNGRGIISRANRHRLETLSNLVRETMGECYQPLYRRYTTVPLVPGEPSVFELLSKDPWNIPLIRSGLKKARDLTLVWRAKQSSGPNQQSRSEQESNLLYNLLSHGLEG